MITFDDRILERYNENEIFLLLWIAKRMCNNSTAWPSLSTLKKDTRWSKSKILAVRKSLEEKGALKTGRRERENGSYTSNEYEVLVTEIWPGGKNIRSQNQTRVVSESDKGSSKTKQALVPKADKKEKGRKKGKNKKEEEVIAASPDFFSICLATLKEHSDEIPSATEEVLQKIAQKFVLGDRTLDPRSDGSVKGLIGWAKGYINNLPKAPYGESGSMAIVEEVSTLFTKHFIRRPSDRAKAAVKFKIHELMKRGETLEDFEKIFAWARSSGGQKWNDFETSIEGYERLKSYSYNSVA